MKDKLLKLIRAKEEARAALVAKSEKSEDVAELRSIQTQIDGINADIAEARGLLSDLEAAEKAGGEEQEARTKAVNGSAVTPGQQGGESRGFTPGVGFSPVAGGTPGAKAMSRVPCCVRPVSWMIFCASF